MNDTTQLVSMLVGATVPQTRVWSNICVKFVTAHTPPAETYMPKTKVMGSAPPLQLHSPPRFKS